MEYVEMEPRKGTGARWLSYTLNDFYREYKKECKLQYGKGYTKKMLPKDIFIDVLRTYLEELADKIITDRECFRMPKRLGKLCIVKKKCIKGEKQERRVTFPKNVSEEAKKKLAYFWRNHYTDCYFIWTWKKMQSRNTMRFIGWYSFKESRKIKTKLSDYIYECSKNPYIKDYDAPWHERKRVNNPLNIPI